MEERELLELAAKAAGLEVEWNASSGFYEYIPSGQRGYVRWKPLTDDGDAFRLMHAIYPKTTMDQVVRVYEHVWGGSIEQTRRAIVRAAAEIGRAM